MAACWPAMASLSAWISAAVMAAAFFLDLGAGAFWATRLAASNRNRHNLHADFIALSFFSPKNEISPANGGGLFDLLDGFLHFRHHVFGQRSIRKGRCHLLALTEH